MMKLLRFGMYTFLTIFYMRNAMAHTELDMLKQKMDEAAQSVVIGGIYVHYRNPDKPYQVLNLAIQEATEQICVIYKNLYGTELIWVRNLDSWNSMVMHNGDMVPRFALSSLPS